MNKYLLFLIFNLLFIIDSLDSKIMIDYLINSYKYFNIYSKDKKCMLIKLLIFRIIFLILFFIYPIIALYNFIKTKSIDKLKFHLKHPISLFDPTLKSYNLYFQKKDLIVAQNKEYWKILFNHYKFFTTNEIIPESSIIKVLISNNKVQNIKLGDFEINENYVENIINGKIQENILPKNILNSIIKNSILIHKSVNKRFKLIELTVMVYKDEYSFIEGASNPELVKKNDINYIKKSKNIINFLKT